LDRPKIRVQGLLTSDRRKIWLLILTLVTLDHEIRRRHIHIEYPLSDKQLGVAGSDSATTTCQASGHAAVIVGGISIIGIDSHWSTSWLRLLSLFRTIFATNSQSSLLRSRWRYGRCRRRRRWAGLASLTASPSPTVLRCYDQLKIKLF